MAEPLSVAASVVGVVVPALHGIRLLLEDLENIKDAPEAVKRLEGDVRGLKSRVSMLEALDEQEWESLGVVAEDFKKTVSNCSETCIRFRAKLQHWTKHSKDGKLELKKRMKVGFLEQGQIKNMEEQLQSCKLSIQLVFAATNHTYMRRTRVTGNIDEIRKKKQLAIRSAMDTTNKQMKEMKEQLKDLQEIRANHAEDTEEVSETKPQIEENLKTITLSYKLLEGLRSKVEEIVAEAFAEKNRGPLPSITFGHGNKGFQAGIINGGLSELTFGG